MTKYCPICGNNHDSTACPMRGGSYEMADATLDRLKNKMLDKFIQYEHIIAELRKNEKFLQEYRDNLIERVKELESALAEKDRIAQEAVDLLQARVRELEAALRDKPDQSELDAAAFRINHLEAELAAAQERVKELEAERDTWHDRAIAVAAHLDYETTCDNIKIWVYEHKKKVRAIDKRIEELEASHET